MKKREKRDIFALLSKVVPHLVMLALVFFAFYVRVQTINAPMANVWAKQSVENQIKAQIEAQLRQQYPTLPSLVLKDKVNEQYKAFYDQNKEFVDSQISLLAEQFKDRLHLDNASVTTPYLSGIDPYYWLRLARNYVEKGHFYDAIKGGMPYDTHMLAPEGLPLRTVSWHVYVILLVYYVLKIFISNVPLMFASYLVPALLGALIVIPIFYFIRYYTNTLGGAAAALVASTHPVFLGRSAAGFSDTDPYNVLMPILLFIFSIKLVENKSFKKRLLYAFLLVASFFLYAKFWGTWWYSLVLVFAAFAALIVVQAIRLFFNAGKSFNEFKDALLNSKEGRELKSLLLFFLVIIVAMQFIFFLLGNPALYLSIAKQVFVGYVEFKAASKADLWPNVFTTVAELNPMPLYNMISSLGWGKSFLFYIGIISLVAVFFNFKSREDIDKRLLYAGLIGLAYYALFISIVKTSSAVTWTLFASLPVALILIFTLWKKIDISEDRIYLSILTFVWLVGTMFLTLKGVRFVLLTVAPFAIGFGFTLGNLVEALRYWFKTHKKDLSSKMYKGSVALTYVVLALFLIIPFKAAYATSMNEVPMMNDAWYHSLTEIKNVTNETAIITSWWDFGHWFKYVADRPVTFDGASQNSPQAHWVGKLFLTNNTLESFAILRMLDCGANSAFDMLKEYFNDDALKTKTVLDKIILMPREDAKGYLLEQGLSEEQVSKVLDKTHCRPPEAILITSSDMIGKAPVWGHFGAWDFGKAYAYLLAKNSKDEQEAIKNLSEALNITEAEASKMIYTLKSLQSEEAKNAYIARWPAYLSGGWKSCTLNNLTLTVECRLRAAVARQGNAVVVLDSFYYNLFNQSDYGMRIQVLDAATNRVLDEKVENPTRLVVARSEDMKIYYGEPEVLKQMGVLLDLQNFRMLVADPLLLDSMFTKLYFLDARHVPYVEKVGDRIGYTGVRIITWKVDWDKVINDLEDGKALS